MTMVKAKNRPPLLEWIASAIGLLLALGVAAVIARDAFNSNVELPPEITVTALRAQSASGGYLVTFEARNNSPTTAAQVGIEGALPGGETSNVTIDYIPGRSARRGGLYFSTAPRGVRLRALGYQDP